MRNFKITVTAISVALLVAACGGGGGSTVSSKAGITSVKVMGDSLSDSGTFNNAAGNSIGDDRIFSVQGPNSHNWVEDTAADFGVTGLCNFYQFTGSFIANPTPGCTNFAIGGSLINNPASAGGTASPQSIITQLVTAATVNTSYKASDLILIDGGGNDAAALVGAYLAASTDGGASYAALLSTVLSPSVVATNLGAGASGLATAGGLYMTALADNFYAAIKANTLDKGATHVVVLNVPGITNTPRFQMVLDGIAAAYGGGTAGATARAQAEGLFKSWVVAFNTELAAKAAGNSSLVVVDGYTTFNDEIAHPAQYGLTNVTTPACPITGQDASGLPTYTFHTCTATALSAQTPPTGATGGANWWTTYLFSDSFHPTPYGYQLVSELVARSLAQAGWL
jgi:phospholipase/lecithinase/hemolysin